MGLPADVVKDLIAEQKINSAYAMGSSGSSGGGIMAFLPLLLLGCILAFLLKSIAKRKGRNQWLWFIAGFIHFWNALGGLWLASIPDKAIVESLKDLLDKFHFFPKGLQNGLLSAQPQTWKCDCGRENEMNDDSCPVCGLKRDYLLKRGGQAQKS